MTNKVTKYGFLILATVLVMAMVFAGAASADLSDYSETTVNLWVKDGSGNYALQTDYPLSTVKTIYGATSAKAVSSVADLESIGNGVSGTLYILTNDIDFASAGVKTNAILGFNTGTFVGVLIGNGYTISNLSISAVNNVLNNNEKRIGLVGTLGNAGTLNYVQLNNANISANVKSTTSYKACIAVLVGSAGSSSSIIGCKVMHSDVRDIYTEQKSGRFIGGLVGYTSAAGSIIANCSVENCSISCISSFMPTNAYDKAIGGLIGYAISSAYKSPNSIVKGCNVANCSISTGGGTIGGLIGYSTYSGDPEACIISSQVKNCIVSSGNSNVGGLGGSSGSKFKDCIVESCTVASQSTSSPAVGGLVGKGDSTYLLLNNCIATNCAVSGYGANVKSDIGLSGARSISSYTVTGMVVNNATCSDPVINILLNSIPTEARSADITNPSFFQTKGATYSSEAGGAAYTNLGPYGQPGGFGLGSYVQPVPVLTYAVTVDEVENGSFKADPESGSAGTDISVTIDTVDIGYHLNSTYWYNTTEGVCTYFTNSFSLPAYNVNVSGDFKANVTTVKYYNETNACVNTTTYAFGSPFVKPTYDMNESVVLNGWNLSSVTGDIFADADFTIVNESYVISGHTWNYTNATGGILEVYMNFTEIPTYAIDNTSAVRNGTVIASKTRAPADATIHLDAFNTTAGYHFDNWNVTRSTETIPVDAENNFTMPASDVKAGAEFTANITTVHFDNGTGTDDIANSFGSATQTPADPTKEGHSFAGWNVSIGGDWEQFNDPKYNNSGIWNYTGAHMDELTVVANWTVNTYTVSIDPAEHGSVNAIPNVSVPYDSTVDLSCGAVDAGYHFARYDIYKTGDKSTPVENGSDKFTMPAFDVNVSGIFAPNVTTVTFYNNLVSVEKEFTYNETAVALPGVMPFNTFRGWYSDAGIQVFNDTGILNLSATGYVTAAGKWGYEESTLSLYANYSKSEIQVSTNIIGFGTFDLKVNNPVVIPPHYLRVINNLSRPVTFSIEPAGIFEFSPSLTSPLSSFATQVFTVTVNDTYKSLAADHSALLEITDGEGTTTAVKLVVSVVNTTAANASTTTIPTLPDIETKVTGDDVNMTVNKDKVMINTSTPQKYAVISSGSENDVSLVITNITNTTSGDKQEISLAEDSSITAVYPETKADLVSEDNVKVTYQANIVMTDITTDLPTLTGDFNASANDKLALGTNHRSIAMISALNREIETLNEHIESVMITFNISKEDVVGFSIDDLCAFKIKDNGEIVLLDASALSVEEYPEYYLVIATYPDGFSIDGIAVPIPPQYTPSSSSKQSGSTVILKEGEVAPTQAPTVAPTAQQTQGQVDNPTIIPTANPTAQQTQASPVPILGLIAGLGAAAVMLRLRK